MEKFTKHAKKELKQQNINNTVYQDDFISVKKINNRTFVEEKDRIVALPYIKDEGYVFMRAENVPAWKYKYRNNTQLSKTSNFLTMISGSIETGETPSKTLRRELYEEAGIVLSQFYQFDIEGPFFESKGNNSQFYICLIELNYNDYKLVSAPGDGTINEKIAKNLKVSLGDLDEIRINDMVSELLLTKFKKEYNL